MQVEETVNFSVRLPAEDREWLETRAAEQQRTLSGQVRYLIDQARREHERKPTTAEPLTREVA